MSFGEHLEELRSTLWKAIVALLLGFLVGLLFGDNLVRFVQRPLTQGLGKLLREQKQDQFNDAHPDATAAEKEMLEQGMSPDMVTLSTQELIDHMKSIGAVVTTPKEIPPNIPLTLWKNNVEGTQPIATGVSDGFAVYVKASLVIGAVLSSPFIFYFIWSFVAAGLYPHEKNYVKIFLPFSIGLFLLGAIVAFFFVIQYVLAFLFQFYDWMGISPTPRISEWLSFVLILPLMFGLAFQLPLVMLFLERIQIFSAKVYLAYWRYAILVIFILSMLLTPADPQSMLLMAGCLTPLYFGGVLLCKYMPRRVSSFDDELAKKN